MITLYKKEISSFFSSLTGYIVVIVYLLINSLFIWVFPGYMNVLDSGYAKLDTLFTISPWIFLFLVPALTMRLFAEEKEKGTVELLFTRPISNLNIIIAKYLAGLTIVLFSLIPTLIYFLSIYLLGRPVGSIDTGGTWGSYIGLFFLSAIYVAIGVFSSATAKSQIISFVLALVISIFFYMGFDLISSGFSGIETIIMYMGINEHYESMSRGVLDSRDIFYFLGVIVIFIAATRIMIQKQYKHKNIFQLFLIIVIVVFVNYISTFLFFRIDLTAEKRYTLKPVTKEILHSLDDVAFVKIYLEGDLPVGFQEMQHAIGEQLDEFKVYAGENLEYEFINPSESDDKKIREELYRELINQGLEPVNIKKKDEEGAISQKIIFPGAIISFKDRQLAVNLLKNIKTKSSEENLNNSIESLEYEFTTAIKGLSEEKIRKIAFLEGHDELDQYQTEDITREFANFFQVDRGSITTMGCLDSYEVVIIAKPRHAFSKKDKLVIDQYIMNGGKVIWFIDKVSVNMDSLTHGTTMAMIKDLKLNDQLFKYGVRVNPNLIKDVHCNVIPVNIGHTGGQSKWAPAPWLYFPLLEPPENHPVTKNIDVVKSEFANEIDTLGGNQEIKTTVLLASSKLSKVVSTPMIISLAEVEKPLNRQSFTQPNRPVAVLLEGRFPSVFQNRMIDNLIKKENIKIKEKSKETKMLVVSDGDIIKNDVRHTARGPVISPLGFDRYTNQSFGNKSFIMNALHYMTDQLGLMNLRTKNLKLRLLNKQKIKEERLKWQIINVLAPVIFIIVAGIIVGRYRKKKYAHTETTK